MSFFGGLIKGIAKVASAVGKQALAASPVGKVFNAAKAVASVLKKKRVAPRMVANTMQEQARANKYGERYDAGETSVAGNGPKRRRRARGGSLAVSPLLAMAGAGFESELRPTLSRTRTTYAPRRQKRAKRAAAASGAKRAAPRGGLDLKTMAAQWRAAGKPGTWLAWIKANPVKKPV